MAHDMTVIVMRGAAGKATVMWACAWDRDLVRDENQAPHVPYARLATDGLCRKCGPRNATYILKQCRGVSWSLAE